MVRGVGAAVVVFTFLLGCSVGRQFVSFLPISQASWRRPASLLDVICDRKGYLSFGSAVEGFAEFHEWRGAV